VAVVRKKKAEWVSRAEIRFEFGPTLNPRPKVEKKTTIILATFFELAFFFVYKMRK